MDDTFERKIRKWLFDQKSIFGDLPPSPPPEISADPISVRAYSNRENIERGYHREGFTYHGRMEAAIGKKCFPAVPRKGLILDWGCSEGWTTKELQGLYPESQVVGLDFRREASWARGSNAALKFVQADGFEPPFRNKTFDAVFAANNICQVLEYMGPEVQQSRLCTIGELVKEGGTLVLIGHYNNDGELGHNSVRLQRDGDTFGILGFHYTPFVRNKLRFEAILKAFSIPKPNDYDPLYAHYPDEYLNR